MNVINFIKSKTGQYSMPLHPELKAYLLPRGRKGLCDPAKAAEGKDQAYLSGMFTEQVLRQCSFKANFKQFRHTFITRLALAKVDKRHAQLMTNHADEDIHE